MAHNRGDPAGHLRSQRVNDANAAIAELVGGSRAEIFDSSTENVTKRHDPASQDTGSKKERAKRFELSTFTLGTGENKSQYRPEKQSEVRYEKSANTISAQNPLDYTDLATLIRAWPRLPAPIRAVIILLVQSVDPEKV